MLSFLLALGLLLATSAASAADAYVLGPAATTSTAVHRREPLARTVTAGDCGQPWTFADVDDPRSGVRMVLLPAPPKEALLWVDDPWTPAAGPERPKVVRMYLNAPDGRTAEITFRAEQQT